MWLLNHGTARKFELPMLKKLGIEEIFLPKIYPSDPRFRSASVDYSEDKNLTIPPDALATLNEQNWYSNPSAKAWEIANEYFPVLFFILHDPALIRSISRFYKGIAIWRAYGLDKTINYTHILAVTNNSTHIKQLNDRFVFGQAYSHLHRNEAPLISERHINLPAGMDNCDIKDNWTGTNKKIYFVCPDVGFNNYYQQIYKDFIDQFGDFPYLIAGSQIVYVSNPSVLGFVSQEVHDYNMRETRVMYYHSTEPNHVHYHPFEAIRVGMPLVFMANGLLDKLGGASLPGRCIDISEAKNKIKRILNDDWNLINSIRKSQVSLLNSMKAENCYDDWLQGFVKINALVTKNKKQISVVAAKTYRIAIFVHENDVPYELQLMYQMLTQGAHSAGKDIELLFAFEEGKEPLIKPKTPYRLFKWKMLNHATSVRMFAYTNCSRKLSECGYFLPDDGFNHFFDCDLWILSSNCQQYPILPMRPYIISALNFASCPELNSKGLFGRALQHSAHFAEAIFTVSQFLRDNLVRIGGIPETKVKTWLLHSEFDASRVKTSLSERKGFLWMIDQNCQKNIEFISETLRFYYDKLKGQLECHVVGFSTLNPKLTNKLQWFVNQPKIIVHQHLSAETYFHLLSVVKFLWHPNLTDSNLYTIFDCSSLNVDILALKQPALELLAEQFTLNIRWLEGHDANQYAQSLKKMETKLDQNNIISIKKPFIKQMNELKQSYWDVVEQCL